MQNQRFRLRPVILALAFVASALPASAQQLQGAPAWPGVTLPTFVIPASAVNGGGGFVGQLIGPLDTDCSAPAFTGIGKLTTGFAVRTAPSAVVCVNGTLRLTVDGNGDTTGTRDIAAGRFLISATDTGGLLTGASNDTNWLREAAGHSFQRNSTNAQRASWANTYASTISYEAFSIDWQTSANVAMVGTRTAATGTNRPLRLLSQASSGADNYVQAILSQSAPFVRIDHATIGLTTLNDTSTGNFFQIGGSLNATTTTGPVNWVAITPIYNEASGAVVNTDLLIQRTETAIGTGAQYAIQTQRGSTNQFTVTAGSSTKGTQLATAQASVPTITTNPGTGGACVGADTFMTCTEGTSPAAAATFTVTFNGTWAAAPSCIAIRGTAGSTPLVQNVVTTTTTVQVNLSANLVASEKFHIHCGGVQ